MAGFIGPPLPLDGEVEHLGPVAVRPSPQSNDIDFDDLIYLADRNIGFEITEPRR